MTTKKNQVTPSGADKQLMDYRSTWGPWQRVGDGQRRHSVVTVATGGTPSALTQNYWPRRAQES